MFHVGADRLAGLRYQASGRVAGLRRGGDGHGGLWLGVPCCCTC